MTDVLLVDGNNLAHRAWHVAGGEPVRATELLASMVRRATFETRPTFGALAYDAPNCFRRDIDPTYKASRGARPGDLVLWLDRLSKAAMLGNLLVATAPRHEADDVLATLTTEATGRGLSVALVTSDRDAYALVSETVRILPPGGAAIGPAEVLAKLGVPPRLVCTYKALVGDASDNVGGVPGVGPVWARRFLRDGMTLDQALDALTRPPVRIRLDEAQAAGRLAYELVRLRTEAPIGRAFEGFRVGA